MTFPEFEAEGVRLINGDCLDVMPTLEAGSVDLILSDLPYGTTCCRWDTVIPFEPLWACFKRVLKPKGAVVLTASQPFTSMLVMSNREWFKYEVIWDKVQPTGHLDVKRRPLRVCESIIVFTDGQSTYNPQMGTGKANSRTPGGKQSEVYGAFESQGRPSDTTRFPTTLVTISSGRSPNTPAFHPTQKPVALFEYLIRTYSNAGEMILDATIGSGTTAVAAINTDRRCVGIERDPDYFAAACKRVEATRLPLLTEGTA